MAEPKTKTAVKKEAPKPADTPENLAAQVHMVLGNVHFVQGVEDVAKAYGGTPDNIMTIDEMVANEAHIKATQSKTVAMVKKRLTPEQMRAELDATLPAAVEKMKRDKELRGTQERIMKKAQNGYTNGKTVVPGVPDSNPDDLSFNAVEAVGLAVKRFRTDFKDSIAKLEAGGEPLALDGDPIQALKKLNEKLPNPVKFEERAPGQSPATK